MAQNKEKFYITTAIAYSSRKPHFGNTYEVIMTDAVARFQRQMGRDVFFLTGNRRALCAARASRLGDREWHRLYPEDPCGQGRVPRHTALRR